jgi:hypothetical protein
MTNTQENTRRDGVRSIDCSEFTEDDCLSCCNADYAAECGELACLTHEEVDRLASLGLLEKCAADCDQFPDAEYGYMMTEKGQRLAEDFRSGIYIPNVRDHRCSPEASATNTER